MSRLTAYDIAQALGKCQKKTGGGYKALCPAHRDSDPSLSIDEDNGTILVNCQSGVCSQGQVIAALKERGLWPSTGFRRNGNKDGIKGAKPAPSQTPQTKEEDTRETVFDVPASAAKPTFKHRDHGTPKDCNIWAYRNADGHIMFYDVRFDGPTKKLGAGEKVVLPYTYVRDQKTGKCYWTWRAADAPRPLMGLDELAARPDAPVIIVEGAKCREAAKRCLPEFVALTWPGGGKAVHLADCKVLAGRRVWIWPDFDEPGFLAARKMCKILHDLHVLEIHPLGKIAETCTNGPEFCREIVKTCSFDIADCENVQWTPAQFAEFMQFSEGPITRFEQNVHVSRGSVHVLEILDSQNVHENVQNVQDGAAPDAKRAIKHDPFSGIASNGKPALMPIGYDRDIYYYISRETSQIHVLAASSHKKLNLISMISNSGFWELFATPKKTGPDWDACATELMYQCKQQGIFSADYIRGRGCWFDEGHVVFHLGSRLLIDGKPADTLTRPGRFVYEAAGKLSGPAKEPLSDNDASLVYHIARSFCWERKLSGILCAGWVALAPVCGALDWRPHIWITGGAGTGKSTVLNKFITPLLAGISVSVQGGSTEAGIRQTLGQDALPVMHDEAEGEDERGQQRIKIILQLMRQASSESEARTMKGGQSGKASVFHIRSMFALASISVGLKQQADLTRVAVLSLRHAKEENQWIDLQEKMKPINREFGKKLVARTVGLIPIIRENAALLATEIAAVTNSQRVGDQMGTLLAGAYSLVSSELLTQTQAAEIVAKEDWTEFTGALDPDELQCLQSILQFQLRVETGGQALTLSVGELAELAANYAQMQRVPRDLADGILRRHGIKVDPIQKTLAVANKHRELERMLRDTPYSVNWNRFLARIEGAVTDMPAMRFSAGVVSRGVMLPLDKIIIPEEVQDELPF